MDKLKVGDKVSWRGCFGGDEPKEATVLTIEKTERYREKYGKPVDECLWSDYFVVTLDNRHWAYSDQLAPLVAA